MALPVTLDYKDFEAPIDVVARLAAANGFPSLRAFLAHTDTNARAILEGDADALAMVSEWSAVPVSSLARLISERATPGGTWRMGGATFNKEMRPGRTMRFCAKCVLDDRAREPGRMVARAYRRAWWPVRGIEACEVHGCMITEVPVDTDVDLHDFPRFVQANLEMIEAAAGSANRGRQPGLDRYLINQIKGIGQGGLIDKLDAHVTAEFSRGLGELLKLHDVDECMDDQTDVREWGFRLAEKGEEEIRRVVGHALDRTRPRAGFAEPSLGRPMAMWFRRNLDKAPYQLLIDLMQDIVEHHVPFGEGQVILKPVQKRRLYCVNSAHADFGLTHVRIRALMKMNDPNFRHGLADSSTYFDAVALRPILEEATGTLTSKEAWTLLGVGEAKFHHLLHDGILAQVETKGDEERAYTRIRKEAVDDLTRRLAERATVVADDEGMWSLGDAARAMHREFRKLVAMILNGRVEAFIVPSEEPIFRRLRLKKGALKIDTSPTAGSDDELMRTKEAEQALGTTTGTIKELVLRGHLRERHVRRETGLTARFIERQSLADFDAAHASLSAIAKSRQGYRAHIKQELEALGVAPIFEPEGFNARFYRRADLARVDYRM